MAEKKQAVIDAYNQLASSFKQASSAAQDYADAISHAKDKDQLNQLVKNPPAFPGLVKDHDDDSDVKGGKGTIKLTKSGKEKKYKDPNAPKRPASAYLEFQNAVRQQFRDADPGLAYSEVLRKIADTWSHMSVEDKKHWNDITAAKTVEYEAAKAAYTPVDAEGNEIPVPAPKAKKSSSSASTTAAGTTLSKDGKEYTGKKRGRKSNAEKAALLAAAEKEGQGQGQEGVLDQIEKAVEAAPKKEKKVKKVASPPPAKSSSSSKKDKAVKAPSPSASSDSEDSSASSSSDPSSSSSGSESGSSSGSDDGSSDDDSEPAPIVPVKSSSKSNGGGAKSSSSKKGSVSAAKEKEEKPKSKKQRTA